MTSDEQFQGIEPNDKTISLLLSHLHQMRQAVPVNYKLKAELRQRLLEQMNKLDPNKQQEPIRKRYSSRIIGWWAVVVIALAVLSGLVLFNDYDQIALGKPKVLSLPHSQGIQQVALSPTGEQVAYVTEESQLLTYNVKQDTYNRAIRLPSNEGKYTSVAWSNDSSQFAVVEQTSSVSRLWIVNANTDEAMGSGRLIEELPAAEMSSPTWSADNRTIAYTLRQAGQSEIWINSTLSLLSRKITVGHDPEYSPDGSTLAFVNDGTIWTISLDSGDLKNIGKGSWPAWVSENKLTYTADSGMLVEVRIEEENVLSVPHLIPLIQEETLQRAYWSKDGRFALIASQSVQGIHFSIAARD